MMTQELATLGGGCFWCLEAIYDQLKGVSDVSSGYAGGHVENPSYKQICTGTTGHAEVVQITFDPDVISYRDLLNIFFTVHDPTTLNRQGNDIGTQYRTAIYTHSTTQATTAREALTAAEQAGLWPNPIVTEITALETFYPAEDYHRDYFETNPNQGYCRVVIAPKVAKFRQNYMANLKKI